METSWGVHVFGGTQKQRETIQEAAERFELRLESDERDGGITIWDLPSHIAHGLSEGFNALGIKSFTDASFTRET